MKAENAPQLLETRVGWKRNAKYCVFKKQCGNTVLECINKNIESELNVQRRGFIVFRGYSE